MVTDSIPSIEFYFSYFILFSTVDEHKKWNNIIDGFAESMGVHVSVSASVASVVLPKIAIT